MAIERCISAFEIIKSNCIKYNVNEIVCVATSALRDAKNSRNIIQLIKKRFSYYGGHMIYFFKNKKLYNLKYNINFLDEF